MKRTFLPLEQVKGDKKDSQMFQRQFRRPTEPEVQTMSNSFDFATIDPTKPASLKQVFAVSGKFTTFAAKELSVPKTKLRILRSRVNSSVMSLEPNHGQIQKWFKVKTLPKQVLNLIKTDGLSEDSKESPKPKATKKSKTSRKTSKKSTTSPEASPEENKSASGNRSWKPSKIQEEFNSRINGLETVAAEQSKTLTAILEKLTAS
tara:strand:+ start:264 stop:878 length:615 start_codon:yes stop_codon:yes gene_type:complete